MEVKKANNTPQFDGKRAVEFFGEVKQEFKAISWTPKNELTTYTKVVIGSTFVFGMFIYMVDLVIQGTLQGLSLFVKLIGG
jgi:preprotein translocase subunit SecE